MPRHRTRFAGIFLAFLLTALLAGCGGSGQAGATASSSRTSAPVRRASTPTPTPTAQVGPPAAAQNLTFSGDVQGTMTALVAQSSQTPSACSERPVQSTAWASVLYGAVNGVVYGFLATVKPYNGPGTYSAAQAKVQLFDVGDQQQGWESLPGNPVTFTVDNGDLTGSVEATLTNLSSNRATLTIDGGWSCAP